MTQIFGDSVGGGPLYCLSKRSSPSIEFSLSRLLGAPGMIFAVMGMYRGQKLTLCVTPYQYIVVLDVHEYTPNNAS